MMNARTLLVAMTALLCLSWATPCLAGFQVLGSLSREARAEPGARLSGRILVHNTGTEVLELEASQSDYWFSAEGTNRYGAPGSEPRSNARWIHVSPKQLRVPAGETLSFTYEVAVPADESLSGSYWSIVMVAPILQPLVPEGGAGERRVSVQTTMRYAVQLITEVGPPAPAAIEVRQASLEQDDAGVRLTLDLENVGLRHTRPQVWLEVFDAGGAAIGRWPATSKRLYPTTSARLTIPLVGIPPGQYSALLVADLGNDEVFGAQYNLDIR